MARIPAVPEAEAGFFGRLAYGYARRRFGAMPEPFAVARHHKRLFWAGAVAESAYEKAATVLPARLRQLAVYRTATVVGCSWCVDFGAMLQRLDGLDVDRLQHIDEYPDSPLYTDDERLALAYADAMTAQPMAVTDDQVAALEAAFGPGRAHRAHPRDRAGEHAGAQQPRAGHHRSGVRRGVPVVASRSASDFATLSRAASNFSGFSTPLTARTRSSSTVNVVTEAGSSSVPGTKNPSSPLTSTGYASSVAGP